MEEKRLIAAVEAILFVIGDIVEPESLASLFDVDVGQIFNSIEFLQQKYQRQDSGICLQKIAHGYQMIVKPEFAPYVEKFLKPVNKHRLSNAALETLAIVAYRQPITKSEIEDIRGVNSDKTVAMLLEQGLIKAVGRLSAPGRPVQYGTTDEFLKRFGLYDIKDLPKLDI